MNQYKQPLQPHYRHEYTLPTYWIESIDLSIELSATLTQVHSRLVLKRRQGMSDSSVMLQGEELQLKAIKLNDRLLSTNDYRLDERGLYLTNLPEYVVLEIDVWINPQANTALIGLYNSKGTLVTQCEAEGFRRLTYFIDRPDVMATFNTTLIANKTTYPILLSNGNLVESGELANNFHWVKWHDPFKKPCYLFAIVAGDLSCLTDYFLTRSGRKICLQIYAAKEYIAQCQHAMECLKKAMCWDEEVFGREYDLDMLMIVAIDDFNMGAMENKGLNIFNSKYILVDPETGTDEDFLAIESVIGHEYFHNWSGNRITCRDWFQLSLKEGLTIFREQEFSADMNSRSVVRINEIKFLRSVQFLEDAGPLAHPVRPDTYIEINNFYTATVYNKGAEVIRMLQTRLGKTEFMRGMALYFKRYDGQAVTIDDFIQAMSDISGANLEQFKRWYSQAGTPELLVEQSYNVSNKTYTLTVSQSCPATPDQPIKEPFDIPLSMGLIDQQGCPINLVLAEDKNSIGLPTRVLNIQYEKQSFQFINIEEQPIPSLLRDFSAPVKLKFTYSANDLLLLLRHDTDDFARWEASQNLMLYCFQRMLNDYRQEKILKVPEILVTAYKDLLANKQLERALLAQLLIFPAETYLASELPTPVLVEEIHTIREYLIEFLGNSLADEFYKLYKSSQFKQAYLFSAEQVGLRAVKNLALSYLVASKKTTYLDLAVKQFQTADNMTDQLSAIRALCQYDSAHRQEVLEQFYTRWQRQPLVINKWFSLQAAANVPTVLQEVKSLLSANDFDLKNPNNVSSLIGVFSRQNHFYFHEIQGKGYELVAEQIIKLNSLNPQVAARLLIPFTNWQRYDTQRQQLIRSSLKKIFASPNLSKDVYEIISKSLNTDN